MQTPSSMEAFTAAYQTLNKEQRRAVDTIEGPVMVIAGPGTGKTQILTLRIANILKQTDVQPSNILALTFTESGARAMRDRLRSFIGHRAYDVGIYTFHGFADMVIRRYPEAFPHIIGARPVTAIEQVRIVEAVLEQGGHKALRPSGDPTYYIKPIVSAIATLKQEYISPDEFALRISTQEEALRGIEQWHEKGAHKGKERGEYTKAATKLQRNLELLAIYRGYQAALAGGRLYDFSDMISEVVRALEGNGTLLLELQEQYQYVLADEHQDVNGSQNRLLECLVSFHQHPNIFVVGDEKQAIYRFQGASLDNFLYFESVFGETTTIALTDNYRSGQPVLDAAHALVSTEDPRLAALRVPLTASLVTSAQIEFRTFAHEAVEHDWLLKEVNNVIAAGVAPEEIAIIMRTNRDVERCSAQLRQAGITVSASADSDILEHTIVREALRLFRAVANPADDEALGEVLLAPYLGVPLGEVAILFSLRREGTPLITHIENRIAAGEASEALQRYKATVEKIRTSSTTTAVHRQIEMLCTEVGFTANVLATDPYESARVVRRLLDEIEGMVRRGDVVTISDVVNQLRLHTTYGLPLTAPYIHTSSAAVQVMTAHKSKGLEFNTVFIPGLTDSNWGKKTSRTLFELPIVRHDVGDTDTVEDDERRLLYVAMTRAKRTLHLTYANETVDGRGSIVSRFVSDIESYLSRESTESFEQAYKVLIPALPTPPPAYENFIKETLLRRGWSPTALNNYIENPWHYFFSNVLRVPTVKGMELQYGTAMHAVLERVVKAQSWTTTFLSEQLRVALDREALTVAESAQLHERGLVALTAYVEQLTQIQTTESRTEVSLQALLPTGRNDVPEILITGNLDRVDYENGQVVRVVDYKTGKPKSRNVIEGNTKDSNGAYKRQLVFYALLLSLQPDTAMLCRVGTLSFVEPTSSGDVKEESFTITDEEITLLKEEILAATSAVLDGTALQKACDSSVTPYCHIIPFTPQ